MERHRLRSTVAACILLVAFVLASMRGSEAQTWHWTYVTHTPNSPPVAAISTVNITGGSVRISYTLPVQARQIIIESCRANLHDIDAATTISTAGTTYLLVRFKAGRTAACASGLRPAVALPTNDRRIVESVAAGINRTCCTVAAARPSHANPVPRGPKTSRSPSPSPSPPTSPQTASPVPSPEASARTTASPSPSAPPIEPRLLRDWVETDGLFWFVRVHNDAAVPLTTTGEVFACRNVDLGCGPFGRIELEPHSSATVATLAAARGGTPAFRYRYRAQEGARTLEFSGSSGKLLPHGSARMSAQELRTAQAVALNRLQTTGTAAAPILPARLVTRGSSRLAIGQRGTAVVRLTIASNGTPQDATIVSITNKALTAAAIETAISSTYAPATQNGRGVEAKYIATFSFNGEDPALQDVPVWKRPLPPAQPSPSTSPSPSSAPQIQAPTAPAVPTPAAAPPSIPSTAPSPLP